MYILDQFSAAGTLWVKVIEQAMQDLVSRDNLLALNAAEYFFLEPSGGNARDMRTFAGLCAATKINADAAARAVFGKLKPHQRERILRLLKEAGFEGCGPVVM